jgi:malonyl-CoA O-methyltransferase
MYNYNKQLVARDFSRAAPRYDEHAGLQRHAAEGVLARALFPEAASVLDLGCGTGHLARHAPPGWSITQLDIAEGMCERAADAAPTLRADMEALPFRAGAFDGVLSSLALQWTDPARVFAEAARVLKPAGRLVFSTLGPQTFAELRAVLAAEAGTARTSAFPDKQYLEKSLQAAGFGAVAWQESLTREVWPDALALMRGIRAMGAANKGADRAMRLTEKTLAAAAARYRQEHPAPGGIYATWQLWYGVACLGDEPLTQPSPPRGEGYKGKP